MNPAVILVLLCSVFCAVQAKLFFGSKFGPPPIEPANSRAVAPDCRWITQKVDQFNPTDLRTWQMRYLNNSQFFREGGPIFIYVGGEWTILPETIQTGQIFDMAEEHGGYLFYTEHRFYGESNPTEDLSVENLRFLSADQALADLAFFIKHVKQTIPELSNSKVVVVGASYAATLATWARIKYPHLIDIAYASSGPVQAINDFYGYNEVVSDNIGRVSPICLNTIKESIEQLEIALESEEGIFYVSESFQTCNRLINEGQHRAFFFYMGISDLFGELVQYGTDYLIEVYCQSLVNFSGTALQKLGAWIRAIYGDLCMEDYDIFLERYVSTALTTDYYRQWVYQLCTEFGFFTSTASDRQPFGNNFALDFFLNACVDLYGVTSNETVLNIGTNRTNILYGSRKPEVTRLISVHGTLDPWHRLGIIEDLNPLAPAIFINGSSHCADLSSVSDSDFPELREAKIRIKQIIADWLQQI